ncbi:MAG TPA: BlaI/MecI/CopY family transcriptional regulator [Thermoanaerobaculia bacterium]|nr:BlaI/MecI/CopY family transcriptional regulator [Thermoanaerobaculia bacterium]
MSKKRPSRTPPGPEPVQLSDTEWTVMDAVWNAPPATARDVHDVCFGDTGWAYTTVKTLLDRLVGKGALGESKRANVSIYEPLITREQARRSALRRLVDRAFGGALPSLVHHLVDVERLGDRDRAELETALREAPSGRARRRRQRTQS